MKVALLMDFEAACLKDVDPFVLITIVAIPSLLEVSGEEFIVFQSTGSLPAVTEYTVTVILVFVLLVRTELLKCG